MNNHQDCMSSEEWNKIGFWSTTNNPIFQKIINFVTICYRKKIFAMFQKNNVRGENILELGCGTGKDTIWLIENFNFAKATLVDFSDHALQTAKKTKGNLSIKLIKKDVLKLQLKERFDLVHSGFVVEHFWHKNREKVIKKHAELAKNNGFVFIQAPGKTILSLLYSKTINKMNGINELLYSKKELEMLFKKAGLKIIKFQSLFLGSVFLILAKKGKISLHLQIAGAEGIEPPIELLESPVIPFNYAPKFPQLKNSPARRVYFLKHTNPPAVIYRSVCSTKLK